MMNHIPARFRKKLATLFLLVRRTQADCRSWLSLFSVGYFYHNKDGDVTRSHNQAHTMDNVIIGCSPNSNAALFYNPRNKQFYEPDLYRIDPHRLSGSIYSNIKYDGGLFCSLRRNNTPNQDKKFPQGTHVEQPHSNTGVLSSGTVFDIPLDMFQPDKDKLYLIQFDDSTTISVPTSDMLLLVVKPLMVDNTKQDTLLLPFLQVCG